MKRNSLLLNKNFSAKGENYKLVSSNFYFILNQNLMNFMFPNRDFYSDVSFKRYNKKNFRFLLLLTIVKILFL